MIFNCSTSQPVPRDLPLTKAMNDETYREFVIEIVNSSLLYIFNVPSMGCMLSFENLCTD